MSDSAHEAVMEMLGKAVEMAAIRTDAVAFHNEVIDVGAKYGLPAPVAALIFGAIVGQLAAMTAEDDGELISTKLERLRTAYERGIVRGIGMRAKRQGKMA